MTQKIIKDGVSLREISVLAEGRLIGDPECRAFGICPLDEPRPGFLAFTRQFSVKRISAALGELEIAGLICPDKKELQALERVKGNFILVPEAMQAVLKLMPLFFEQPQLRPGISPKADISPSAEIGARVYVGPFAVIGDHVKIGDDAVIHAHAVIYRDAVIGPRAVLHAGAIIREECIVGPDNVIQNGAVIGADGFGYLPDPQLGLRAVPQVGNTVLAERVEVGANSCIDRATLGSTVVDVGTKIDNHVQVGHNCKIGRHSILCGQVGLAGSARIGSGVVLAGNVGVADHVSIADGARVGAKAGVSADITDKGDWAGYPPVTAHRWRMQCAVIEKLPEMYRELKELLRESRERRGETASRPEISEADSREKK